MKRAVLALLVIGCLWTNAAFAQQEKTVRHHQANTTSTNSLYAGFILERHLKVDPGRFLKKKEGLAQMPIYNPGGEVNAEIKLWKPSGQYFYSMPNYFSDNDRSLLKKNDQGRN